MDGGYALLDHGDGARLERFAARVTDRPLAGAFNVRRDPRAWRTADLRFDRERGWTGEPAALTPWPIDVDGVTLELRPTEAGQVGLFPEHRAMLPWLRARVEERADARAPSRLAPDAADAPGTAAGPPAVPGRPAVPGPPAVLHLFGYTGLATLAMAASGAAVVHLDASRPTIAWARHNAELAGLTDRPIRWIVDDALAFTEREVRRERHYAGVVLDPPSYGHGTGTRPWQFEADLPRLLAACAQVLEPDGFILLTAHTPGFGADRLASALGSATGRRPAVVDAGELFLSTPDGRRLELGAFAHSPGGA